MTNHPKPLLIPISFSIPLPDHNRLRALIGSYSPEAFAKEAVLLMLDELDQAKRRRCQPDEPSCLPPTSSQVHLSPLPRLLDSILLPGSVPLTHTQGDFV